MSQPITNTWISYSRVGMFDVLRCVTCSGGLSKFDADRIITSLKPIPIEKVGSAEWMKQRQNIEQLNMQAHQNVMMNHDEFIKEELNVQDKVKVLIHELIVIEIWKAKVAPLIWSEMVQTSAKKSLKPYLLVNYLTLQI